MDWSALAIVEINFTGQPLKDEDAQAIEALLRKDETVSNLAMRNDKMTFSIWGKGSVDYKILDQVKNQFKDSKNLVISAREYKEIGKKYYYDAGQQKNVDKS